MNTHVLFIFITFGSLALAAGMTVVLFRVLREERQRSDARVEALSRMAAGTIWERDMPAFLPEPDAPADHFSALPDESLPDESLTGEMLQGESRQTAAAGTLFAEPEATSPWGPRAAIAGGLAACALTIAALGMAWSSSSKPAAAPRPSAPLELVSLNHTQTATGLTVSGRVQNPSGSPQTEALTATVFLFGSDGSFLTSGRAPLDVSSLRPGGESAFVVSIPVNGTVARYRVSFRDSAGHPVAHVDRRTPESLARNQ
jgi:hypothetical protein